MNIFLTGYRCTGKSSTGKILAGLIQAPFVDTDRMIEEQWNTSIADMVHTHGWEGFRKREKQIFTRIVQSGDQKGSYQVVATGGGMVMDPDNRNLIRTRGVGVWLQADARIIAERLVRDRDFLDARPRFDDRVSLMEETMNTIQYRQPLYRECSSLILDAGKDSPEELAHKIRDQVWLFRQFPDHQQDARCKAARSQKWGQQHPESYSTCTVGGCCRS